MSEPPSPAGGAPSGSTSSSASPTSAPPPPPKQNPAFKALGLPNIRPRLPSRNWLIFLSLSGSFTLAVLHDRHRKRRVQEKWCGLVAPLRGEAVSPKVLPRRVRVYIQAPPGDGLRPARELFYEYVKPVLVAAGMEWEVVEGRREGDVRWGKAEGVRRERRREGEGEGMSDVDAVREVREAAGVRDEGVSGELVVGRHTWKEYVRGLHEGWLGPVDKVEEEQQGDSGGGTGEDERGGSSWSEEMVEKLEDVLDVDQEASPTAAVEVEEKEAEKEKSEEGKAEEEERKKRLKPAPYNSTADYAAAQLPRSIPEQLGPTTVIPFPHLIGFTYTPRRLWRFLHRRELADTIGREVAALILASRSRPYEVESSSEAGPSSGSPSLEPPSGDRASWQGRRVWEQERVLAHEEEEWHKSIKRREKVEGEEDVWKDPMVLDERIAGRMRVYELSREDEERAVRIAGGEEKVVREGKD